MDPIVVVMHLVMVLIITIIIQPVIWVMLMLRTATLSNWKNVVVSDTHSTNFLQLL
jgi:hypothetical protein